jgi:CRISPR-associated protein Csd1
MILQSLVALAQRERLVEEPAFESAAVRWVVDLDEEGGFLSVRDTYYVPPASGEGRKPKPQAKTMLVPRRTGRTSGERAEFLVDKAEYALGMVMDADHGEERANRRLALFTSELQKAFDATHTAQLKAAIQFLQNGEERSHAMHELPKDDVASNDLFAFRVAGKMLQSLPEVKQYWASSRQPGSAEAPAGHCLVCGNSAASVQNHDKLKIPGASTSGIPLISFNQAAFEKHGLEGSANAPVCRDCMVAYVNALRRCLEDRYPRPDSPGETFPRQSVPLTRDTTAVFWDDASSALSSNVGSLDKNPAVIEKLLISPWTGKEAATPEAAFYVLLLTGTEGRASVRGFYTEKLRELVEHLRLYFQCLQASGFDESKPPLRALLSALAPAGKIKKLPVGLAGDVYLAATLGLPLPRFFLNAVVSRNRAERSVPRSRAALLHLYFALNKKEASQNMALDKESLDPAYRYGRLLSVLENLQYNAQGKVNSNIRDRFYGAAATRPATVFPRLLTLAQAHLRKSTAPVSFANQIQEIIEGLDGAKGFLTTLDIEQQGRFALGYFHERASHMPGKEPENATEEAPENEE